MARKPVTDLSAWPSLTLEGGLIAPAMIASIELRKAPEQTEEDYRIRKGLTIREEISTAFRVGQSHFDGFAKLKNPSAEATRRFMRGFLAETFGFDDLAPADGAAAFLAGGRVPIVVVPPSGETLDKRSAALSAARPRSPALALQDYLNDSEHALWGLVTNGTALRLMRNNASLTRPAYIEADLAQIFTTEDAASFAVLWSLIHRTRFGAAGAPAADCALERWREAGAREGEAARDRLAGQVETALKALGSGFLEANPDLAAKLRSGETNLTEWFNELLRLVYRLIFLMVAEDRDLLHPETAKPQARKLYAEGYSLAKLRAHAGRRAAWDKHHDRYEGIKIVFRALTHGEPALGLPALGGLFGAGLLPHLEGARLKNRALMQALYELSYLKEKAGRVPVNWRAMKTEELGSVYESLLELQPQLGADGKTLAFASEAAERRGNQRKTTGSYYTPDSLVQALLETALDPVLDKTEAEASDPAAALLALSVIDPACGSGHFLLAAASRIATRLARIRSNGTPSLADFRHALRDVARSCLYGVDRNPMAVELTKVALWIETVDPGLPLGFFDAQIRCGDSLLGVLDLKVLDEGVPPAAYKPLTGDDKEAARYYAQKNKRERDERERIAQGFGFARAGDLTRDFAALRAMPETTVAEIEAKAARLAALTGEGASAWRLERACDLYVAAFLLPKRKGGQYAGPGDLPRRGAETVPTSGAIWEWLRGQQPFGPMFAAAVAAARTARAFHWPLEFPDVMQRGGFDVVLGNPPWEVLQFGEEEYFASRLPEIAALPGAARKRAIAALEEERPTIFAAFQADKHHSEAVNEFARNSGRFDLTACGKVNTYALFAELFAGLAGPDGRAGVIVPTGIATDATTAPFFSDLVEKKRLSSIYSFKEIRAVFLATDDRNAFCLLTLGRNQAVARFAFSLEDPAQLAEPERIFTLSPEAIARLNPNTKTAPVFRSRADAELNAKIYAKAPVLIDETKGVAGNSWGVEFRQGLFNMTSDSGLFRTARQLSTEGYVRTGSDWVGGDGRYVPLYEAKMIHLFDHRWAGYADNGSDGSTIGLAEKADSDFEPAPRYWVPEEEVKARTSPLPKLFIEALRGRNLDVVSMYVAHNLFTLRLAEIGLQKALARGLFPEWKAFVETHPALRGLAPTRLGYSGENPALLRPVSLSCLPAAPIDEIVESQNKGTCWYDVDVRLIGAHIRRVTGLGWLRSPEAALKTEDELLRYGQEMLNASLPRWLMGWRDIARATDERTVIATVFPRVGVGHVLPLMFSETSPKFRAGLLGNLCSLVLDYCARQAVGGTHITYGYLKQFPVLPPDFYTEDRLAFIVPKVLELTYTSHSMAPFARDLSYESPPFAWDEERRAHLRAELDAFYARAYGLSRDELRYILDPADVKGADYPSETFRVLKEKEIRSFGEYRTRRLVLAAWDRTAASCEFKALGL
jgi:hypothetical protein